MEDQHYWDQVAIMTKEQDGKTFVATVVASKENKFEVITTMDEERIVITVPISILVDIRNHVRENLSDDEMETLERVAREVKENNETNVAIPIGDFTKNHSDRMSDGTFAPMNILMDRCKFMFDDHFNFSHGGN